MSVSADEKLGMSEQTAVTRDEVRRPRVLIFIVAYNAEKTIGQVLERIPHSLGEDYDVEVLIIDDSSHDRTFERGEVARRARLVPFPLHVLFNPVNQGYGGNQKIGFQYAIDRGFDFLALVHGDGQYAPERLPALLLPLSEGQADAVFGSRMMTRGDAIRGGMPLYKFIGNKILTTYQNFMLRSGLTEFHSGYRAYSVAALRRIPFAMNADGFHFDTEIIIQFFIARMRILEVAIPTYYGDEICHVDGLRYAWDVFMATLKARMQELSLFYDPKYDCAPRSGNRCYEMKLGFPSPHTAALEMVQPGERVLDLGCAGGYLSAELTRRGADTVAVDLVPPAAGVTLGRFVQHDLNLPLPLEMSAFDHVLALDVIEHLRSPEQFVRQLRDSLSGNPKVEVIASTGNVAFVVPRLMLLLGHFNYGKRGILDLTHTRLFTPRSFRRLFEQAGYDVLSLKGIPAPFSMALGEGRAARLLLALNRALVRLSPSLFAYQIVLVVRPRPSLEFLLRDALHSAAERSARIAELAQ
jgi:glycosyltransferase involved in cell wall biosynthesis/2-polyprenyl-3-methyl-5-hydroxy-6-metoxy-1,4-benzoquinol methylase